VAASGTVIVATSTVIGSAAGRARARVARGLFGWRGGTGVAP
jgi:hypothetical protein